MPKKHWELFEENATEYLNSNIQINNFSFATSGGSNSNVSDISVHYKSQSIFNIECKSKTSQAAQFVVINDSENKIFCDSRQNKGKKSRRAPLIEHMNTNYSYYSSKSSVQLICNEKIMFDAVKEHYRDKDVLFFISSNHFEDFSKNFIKIIGLDDMEEDYNISGVYRVKRSGPRDLPQKDLMHVKSIILKQFGECNIEIIDKKAYLITNKVLKNLYLDQKKYLLSPDGRNAYRIKKRSNTQNSNVIFTLTFKPKDTTDNGLQKLKNTMVKSI